MGTSNSHHPDCSNLYPENVFLRLLISLLPLVTNTWDISLCLVGKLPSMSFGTVYVMGCVLSWLRCGSVLLWTRVLCIPQVHSWSGSLLLGCAMTCAFRFCPTESIPAWAWSCPWANMVFLRAGAYAIQGNPSFEKEDELIATNIKWQICNQWQMRTLTRNEERNHYKF